MSTPDELWAEQIAHQAMKAWMQDHGWSTLTSANPADVMAFVEANGDDADFSTFESQTTE